MPDLLIPAIERVQNRLFDVVVVGGGIAGLGIAYELAKKGFDTILIEQSNLATQTSNNSLRIIHGGFRYLQTGNIFRVIESIKEQHHLIKSASNLVKSMPCVMPLDKYGLKSKFFVEIATSFYNFLSEQFTGNKNRAGVLERSFVDKHVELLRGKAPYGALIWYDARLRDPLKLASLWAHKIDREGGEVLINSKVVAISKEGDLFHTEFKYQNESYNILSRLLVNATGPSLDCLKIEGIKRKRKPVVWAKAFNIIIQEKLQERFAVAVHSKVGRSFFVVPRADHSAIGTGYLPCKDPLTDNNVTEDEVKEFLNEFRSAARLHPTTPLTVNSIECGILPVKKISIDGRKVVFLGSSKLSVKDGLIEVLTTKYTTFRALGQRVLKLAMKNLKID